MRLLQNLLKDLSKQGIKPELVIEGSPELDSDLAMPCFSLAKSEKLPPQEIATKIANKINHPAVIKCQAVNGYVNLWLSSKFLLQRLIDWRQQSQDLGRLDFNSKRVIIEYFSPNIAKPLSIGHLRNLLQGRALVNLYKYRGYDVVTDNHLGDWGKTFGMWVVGYLKYSNPDKLKQGGLKELGRIYALIVADLETEKANESNDLEKLVQAWLLKLQGGDKTAWQYHKLFKDLSVAEMDKTLQALDIHFDETLAESFYHRDGASIRLLKRLQKQGLVEKQADGSLIAVFHLDGKKQSFIVLKNNQATLYATSDIAALAYRQQRWNPEKIIYVVGAEQQAYLRKLFNFNQEAQLTNAQLVHHNYGLIEEINQAGQRQKMSSRKRAIHLQDILEEAFQKGQEVNAKGLESEDIEKIAHGAVIFQEFARGRKHNVLFDWDRLFSLSDISGPYVQYATLRLRSILNKSQLTNLQPSLDYDWQAEHKIIMKLLRFEDVLAESVSSSELNKIAYHLWELSKELNRYYQNNVVLHETVMVRVSRLWLAGVVYEHLVTALGLLGIAVPSRM